MHRCHKTSVHIGFFYSDAEAQFCRIPEAFDELHQQAFLLHCGFLWKSPPLIEIIRVHAACMQYLFQTFLKFFEGVIWVRSFEQRIKRNAPMLKDNEVYAILLMDKILSGMRKIAFKYIIYYLSEDI